MTSKSNNTLCTIAMLLASFLAGPRASVIRADLHRDVLLPCQGAFNGAFTLELLVINWQRSDNDAVVHSFFRETDHPEHQEKEFRGRTQLFPQEFHEGNASLLLKDVRESDAENYTCHYIMYDRDGYTPKHVELLMQDEEVLLMSPPDLHGNRRSWYWRLSLLSVSLIIAAVLLIVFRKCKKRPVPEDKEALLSSPPVLYGAIECYRKNVHNTQQQCCKFACPEDESTDEKDGCLHRRFHTISGNKLNKCSEKKKPHECTEYVFEEKERIVKSEDLFTNKTVELLSERILITGDAGFGKTCFSKGLQKRWASGQKDLCYRCIIYVTFNELNAMKGPLSVRSLLESKCPELSAVLTDLLISVKVLIILDGLDEFNHELKVSSQPTAMCDIDTPLEISTLISKVISKELLPYTDVLITSRLSSVHKIRERFTSTFILEAFTEDQVWEYCEKFMAPNYISKSISKFIQEHNLSSLVSIPLLSSALCEIYKKGDCSPHEGALTTSSRMMFCLLQVSLKATLRESGHIDHAMTQKYKVPESIENTIHQLCKISYDNLISGLQVLKKNDLEVNDNLISGVQETKKKDNVNCTETELLLKNLSEFFFTGDIKGDQFEYRHASIRDMFAALYCVRQIQEEDELEKFLNALVFGEMPQVLKVPLLDKINSDDCKRFQSFIRFFFGLLPYGNNSLLSEPLSLRKDRKEFLKGWFQAWIKKNPRKINFFNLLHCVFELQDPDLREDISRSMKNVNLFNIPLNSLDIKALCSCCQYSQLNILDLRLCELDDTGLRELYTIIHTCEDVMLSSNKLTEKSGEILGKLLSDGKCTIEKLWLGTNCLADCGTEHIFKGLENNRSLRILSLKDNKISDFGTICMAQSLKHNKTLKELHLCMNFFGDAGISHINILKQYRPDLKIVIRIAEDEEVFCYTEEKVMGLLSNGTNQYKKTWFFQLLQAVLKDLNDTENTKSYAEGILKERVQMLKKNISILLEK